MLGSVLFVFGLMVGSFLNVCIWRLPAGEQVFKGRSHCRGCGQVIPWYDNIPLVSFLLLKARCRFCQVSISPIYPVVELITALLFLSVWHRFGVTAMGAIYAALGAGLIVVSVVDLREMIIPDEITQPGLGIGVLLSFLFPALHGVNGRWEGFLASLLGALVGGGFVYAIGWVGKQVFRRKLKAIGEEEAMGFGDVKLMAFVGSLIGWKETLLVNLFLAPFLGSIIGLVARYRYGKDLIPYGPFLALGTLAVIVWGDGIIGWYRSFFR